MRKMIVIAAVFGLATAAHAAQAPGQKCQSSKNQEAGKYASCLSKAEAKLLKTEGSCSVTTATDCYDDGDCPMGESCTKDLTKYAAAVTKCEDKFEGKWATLTTKAADALDPCPDGLLAEEIKEVVDEHVANVAAGLAGEGLSSCGDELLTCDSDLTSCETDLGTTEGELTTCETDLGTAETELVTCEGDLTTCDGNLTVCDTDLTTCEGDLVVALECGDGGIDAGEDCDLGNLNGGSCAGEGFAGGVLRCGAGCVYDTSECYATRFEDNGDGTITDNDTGLMWEKKVKLDSTLDLANLQDADNYYRWSGTCSVTTSKRCQPDAASEAACLAGVEGDPTGCSQCTGGEGTCTVTPNGTIWQMVAALNTANYGGHNDWRVPTRLELEGILDLADMTPPVVNVAFQGASCGAVCTDVNDPACSCTQSYDYWSASTYAPSPILAWVVNFSDGFVDFSSKTNDLYVRAVRSGS
jgi:hypothetical protein